MRRFICFIVVLVMVFSLCGCDGVKVFSYKTEQYIVASLGFERNSGEMVLLAEAVVVGTDGATRAEPILIKSEGGNIKEAFLEINKKISQPLLLSHCAVIVMGNSLNSKDYDEIFDFCLKNRQITISAFAVLSENAEDLLKTPPVSSVAVGYDIVGMIENQKENFENRIYQIESAKYKEKNFKLPFFKTDGEEFYYEKTFYYKNGKFIGAKEDENEK